MAKKLAKALRAPARAKHTSVRGMSVPTEPKPKGGPVAGTPSPMRTRMSPELQAHVQRLYEETDQPVCQIALDVGVNESVIRRMGPREGWVRFEAPPRDLPPVATLLATREDNIARFIRVVMAHLDEFEAVRRAGKLIAREHLPTARAISILTDAFNTLQRLRAAQPGRNDDDNADRYADRYDVLPADLDAFREALTQRIESFLASRTDADAFADVAGRPAGAAE